MPTNHVRRHRIALGLSLHELAARSGVAPNTISNIETSKRYGWPATQRAIAAGLGVPARDLFPL